MIYCVEDDLSIRELMLYTLRASGFEAAGFENGEQLFNALSTALPRLILLDIMLPGIDGFELMDYIRSTGIPVIFLTAKNAVSDRVKGLRMGAEDYIVKPFEILELLARVEGVLRRHGKLAATIAVGSVEINTLAMTVFRDGEEIPLTKKEYDIACCLPEIPVSCFTKAPSMSGSGAASIRKAPGPWSYMCSG